MTALEYMKKQRDKHQLNYAKKAERGAPKEVLTNIKLKIGYYNLAVMALDEVYRGIKDGAGK